MKARPQQQQRLERVEAGKQTRFWEVSRTGAVLTLRFGARGDEGRELKKTLPDEERAKQTLAKLVQEKREAGYAEPLVVEKPGAHAKPGLYASNPSMEALIEAAPDDPRSYLVYADWLQSQGDVRGELINVQCGLAADPASDSLLDAQTALFKRFGRELLGGLDRHRTINLPLRNLKGLSWRYGFLRAARLRRISATPLSKIVQTLLSHPSARFLQHLVLGTASFGRDVQTHRESLLQLARAPRTLRSLALGDGCVAELEDSLESLQVERLVLEGNPVLYRNHTASEHLKELHLRDVGDDTLELLAQVSWPGLERLDISPHDVSRPWRTNGLRKLVSHIKTLRRLGLHGSVGNASADRLLDAVLPNVQSSVRQLDLDLDTVTNDALIRHAKVLDNIPLVRVCAACFPDPAERLKLSGKIPSLQWVDDLPDESAPELE